MPHPTPFLAASNTYGSLAIGAGVLIGLLVVGGVGVWYYRRWMFAGEKRPSQPWTLADLRQLRDSGEISEDEYETIRQSMIAGLRADDAESQGVTDR